MVNDKTDELEKETIGLRKLLRIRKDVTATGGTYDYIKTQEVPPGERWTIERHSFENKTGARGTIRAYIEGAQFVQETYPHWVWEQASPGAATLYFDSDDITLEEGERLCVRQASCTSGDQLELLLRGWIAGA